MISERYALGVSYLQDDRFTFIQDSQELSDFENEVDMLDWWDADLDRATGALVSADDGEIVEMWMTDSSRPFDLGAQYVRVI